MEMLLLFKELFSITILAVALGMDAFSVGLGIGMKGIRLKKIFYIGLLVGLFHILMPTIGIFLGRWIHNTFDEVSGLLAGSLLFFIGMNMILQTLIGKKDEVSVTTIGIFIFAFSVSLDSLSIGLSLGIFGTRSVVTIFIFGIVSTILTWLGLYIGRRWKHSLGRYGEIIGGGILIYFGLDNIF